jgi:hypothetical protein
MLFAPHVIKNQDIQNYISKQVTKFNLQAGHARSIDMTQY